MLNRRAGLGRGLLALATVISLTAGSLLALAAPAPAGAQAASFSTASAIPADTLFYSAVDLDRESGQWQQVDELLNRLGVQDGLDQFHSGMMEESDGELTEEELEAFLGGEAAFFVLPEGVESLVEQFEALNEEMAAMAEASPEAMEDMAELGADFEFTGFGAVLEPSDVETAWDVITNQLDEQAASGDVQVTETDEGDASILTITPADEVEQEVVVAQAGDFIIVAGNAIDVQTVVDTANGDADSLADLDAFAEVSAELPAESLFFAYYDARQVNELFAQQFMEGLFTLSPEMAAAAEVDSFGGFALWADDLGFRVDSITLPAEGEDLGALIPEGTVTFDQRVPAATTIFLGGVAPAGAWNAAALSVAQAINAGMTGQEPEVQSFDEMFSEEYIQEQLDQAEQVLGFNLLDDFFGQFQGELAFALTFPDLMTMTSISVDTVFVTEVDDAETVSQSVEMLVRLISSMGGEEMSVTTLDVADDTLYLIGDPATTGIPAIAFGVVEERLLLGTETGVDNFLFMDGVDSALVDDEAYQEALSAFPGDEYYQIAYVDLTDIIPTVMMMSGMGADMGAGMGGIQDANPACLEYSSQEEAQAAFEEDIFENSQLDQDFDGQACEDFFAPASPIAATPEPAGSLEAMESFVAVAYEQDGNLYQSAILFISDTTDTDE